MEKQERQFPELDLSILLGESMYAVHCENEDDASALIHALIQEYPEKCKGWDVDHPRWDLDFVEIEGGMAYYPDINDIEHEDLLHGSVEWALEHGYTVVEFEDLLGFDEMMEVGDMSIEDLLGIM